MDVGHNFVAILVGVVMKDWYFEVQLNVHRVGVIQAPNKLAAKKAVSKLLKEPLDPKKHELSFGPKAKRVLVEVTKNPKGGWKIKRPSKT